MSVLLYDPAEEKHVLLLREGLWAGKRWSVDLRVCDNPCCPCSHVDFLCVPADAAPNVHAASVHFVLNTEKRTIYRAPGHKNSATSQSLAEAVVKELGEAGWKYLYEFLLGIKQDQIENCDPTRLDADFPIEVLQGDETVVGYSDIFPLSAAWSFSIGSERWFAVDDYCVNPGCNCHHAILQFVTREHERRLSRGMKKPPPAMFYDYKNRTFERAQAPEAHQPSLQKLLKELQDQNPGFDKEVKARHKRLKASFGRARRKYDAAEDRGRPTREFEPTPSTELEPGIPPQAKPGRNDPCPCGSVKKYKKCCGR
jgi:hypothetical protein